MSGIQFYSYPGVGEFGRENLHMSQAVRVGNLIICSGQGGWDAESTKVDLENLFKPTLEEQIDQAFKNCDFNLRHAGGAGLSQAYKVTTYALDLPAAHNHIVRNFRKWMPDHPPVWTELEVKRLGMPDMLFEIDVDAFSAPGQSQ